MGLFVEEDMIKGSHRRVELELGKVKPPYEIWKVFGNETGEEVDW
jgi:hypothetical protein